MVSARVLEGFEDLSSSRSYAYIQEHRTLSMETYYWFERYEESQKRLKRDKLQVRNCKSDLWPRVDEESGRKEYAHAPWVLTPTEIATINRRIRSIQTPTGYGASLQNIFTMDDTSLSNLKTHDWHNFLKVDLTFLIANRSYSCESFDLIVNSTYAACPPSCH